MTHNHGTVSAKEAGHLLGIHPKRFFLQADIDVHVAVGSLIQHDLAVLIAGRFLAYSMPFLLHSAFCLHNSPAKAGRSITAGSSFLWTCPRIGCADYIP
jgi:hypothetical protein